LDFDRSIIVCLFIFHFMFNVFLYVLKIIYSSLAIYENVDIVHVFIEIYRIHYYPLVR
jgi:hypothetical protein